MNLLSYRFSTTPPPWRPLHLLLLRPLPLMIRVTGVSPLILHLHRLVLPLLPLREALRRLHQPLFPVLVFLLDHPPVILLSKRLSQTSPLLLHHLIIDRRSQLDLLLPLHRFLLPLNLL